MSTYVRHQQISHRIGAHGSLAVRVTDAEVRLRAADGDEARLDATFEVHAGSEDEAEQLFEAVALEVTAAGDRLEVRERNARYDLASTLRRLVSGRGYATLSIEGSVPATASVQVDEVSGDLVVEGMQGDQRYTSTSGDIFATDLGGSVGMRTVSGDATLRATAPLSLTAQTVSGDLSAVTPILQRARLTSVSGDLEIEAQLDPSGDFRAETVSGDFVIGLAGSATVEVHGISSDVRADIDHRLEGRSDRRRVVIGDGQPRLVFSSMSGDVLVRRPRRLEGNPAPIEAAPATGPVAGPALDETETLEVLQALERGEIDVDEASRRLGGGPSHA